MPIFLCIPVAPEVKLPDICSEVRMKKFYLIICLLVMAVSRLFAANSDTIRIPISRQYFHDKIAQEQNVCDRSDGKLDKSLHVSQNAEINLQVSDAVFRRISAAAMRVEANPLIEKNNDKIRYLSYIENLLKQFRINWRRRDFNPLDFPALMTHFEQAMELQVAGSSLLPLIRDLPYIQARILVDIFQDSQSPNAELSNSVYLKYCALYPDKILQTIRPYIREPFADSLVVAACRYDPVQLYTYAQSVSSPEGKLIHRNSDPMVMAVASLSQTPNALLYFPFLDDLLSGKQSIEQIRKLVGNGEKGYDSVGYYRLLVKTEIEYFRRLTQNPADTPVAMFGANGLREMLKAKALQHFITPINTLHDVNNLNVRMKAIDPLTAQEIYYMMVMGENDIYTSSYKHSFNRMLQKMGPNPRADSLLMSVHADFFKKFIKMAANYNKLDSFLKCMPPASSEVLMKAFVANLHKTGNLEDATDVADSYSSITDKKLLNSILDYVKQNEQVCIDENNQRGAVIYGLLKTIFLSADSSGKVDLTATLGISSIYEVYPRELQDDSGRIVQQVFFYGDEDGKMYFPGFLRSFSPKEWRVNLQKEWVEIRSLKGNVWIFANRPLDNDANLDDSAQVHLNKHIEDLGLQPSVVVHRGHSYWLPRTINRMPENSRIVVLGSCGGYKNLSQIIDVSPDAHIISTKEIGAGEINRPILNYLNQSMLSGKSIVWKDMWQSLGKVFAREPSKSLRESWEDYIPPYRNLGAIFIRAYNKKMESL